MSHFSVAVFTRDDQNIDELLAPFDENGEEEFVSVSEKYKDIWKSQNKLVVKRLNGNYVSPYDSSLYTEITKEEYEKLSKIMPRVLKKSGNIFSEKDTKYYIRDLEKIGAKEMELPLKKIYPTFDEYMESEGIEYCKEEKDYGYYCNPNAKWDWYQAGGRFCDILKLKKDTTNEVTDIGTPSLLMENYKNKDGFCSSAKVKDIDFTPDEEEYKKNLRYWEVVVEGDSLKPGENENDFLSFYKKEYLLKSYKNKENYATICSLPITYAVLTPDGTWYEKGEMGWFGISSETEDESFNWDIHFKERFIDTADPEWILTIVDCHI